MEQEKAVQLNFTKRGFVRLVSFLCALILVLGVGFALEGRAAARYRLRLEENYAQSLTGLASNLSGISQTLQKGVYAATPVQISTLSAQLWRDASAAKVALTSLPLGDLHLDNTNRFLTQVGDYAMALSRKSVSGSELSDEEREQFAALCEYGRGLADQVYQMEQEIIARGITMEQLQREIEELGSQDGAAAPPEGAVGAFQGLEESFSDYPELEYDGPFSDHILKKEPLMLRNVAQISFEEARSRAAEAAGVEPSALQGGSDEASIMPSYTFSGDNVWVYVTKAGGYVSTMMKSRADPPADQLPPTAGETAADGKDSPAQRAILAAQRYLAGRDLAALVPTWYRLADGQCVVNFAPTQGDVLLYPDLVKVTVALDTGEILGFDARGYLSNHYNRTIRSPGLPLAQAREVVGKQLQVESSRLAIIPTAGQYEVYCYEFSALAENGQRVLLYINADTGVEEQILLLTEDETGRFVQ
ncbi:germination protein YpeB [Clostridiaceae bacterium NSJ-31]|uniref:Germination protein YpeB n=1 Tax=Ligaoa zhengdingensis TaxID=2763658 RepID=A0A926E0S1_9FIRM|nr:germination protein YpeB [Ligaoa zhengdingensis]